MAVLLACAVCKLKAGDELLSAEQAANRTLAADKYKVLKLCHGHALDLAEHKLHLGLRNHISNK